MSPARHPDGPLAIVAGAGQLPLDIARAATARGAPVVVMRLSGIADADYAAYDSRSIGLMDPQGALAALADARAGGVVLAGTVHKPRLGLLLGAWQAVVHQAELRRLAEGGDDNILRGVIAFLEGNGFPVVGVRDAAPELMAPSGLLTRTAPGEAALRDASRGLQVLRQTGPFDIGQAVAIAGARVLALEAAEGTDAMIRRVAVLRRRGVIGRILRHGRPAIAERSGGVLVKAPKPGQDMRADLPAIGPATVRRAARAGLDGIAIEAGNVLIVERERTLAAANHHRLFVVGVPA